MYVFVVSPHVFLVEDEVFMIVIFRATIPITSTKIETTTIII